MLPTQSSKTNQKAMFITKEAFLCQILIKNRFIIRHSSDIKPVKLSYATYESTNKENIKLTSNSSPLIINHGLFGSKSNWNTLCKVYQQKTQRKIIAIDARNHGDSPHTPEHTYDYLTEDLLHLIKEELKVERVILMGHSMGGRTCMNFALKYPIIVEKLIIVDISPLKISPNFKTQENLFKFLKTIKLPGKNDNLTMSKARSIVDQQLQKVCSDKAVRSFLLTNLVQNNNSSYRWRINLDGLLDNFKHILTFPKIDSNSQYKGKTLFVAGTNSDFIQESDHDVIKQLFPNAEIKYIEGAGHWVHSEKPAQFLDITIDFLNK